MLSRTALDLIDEWEEKGFRPSPSDIVRLNVLGLRLEAAKGKNLSSSSFLLPRVAAVSESISFRQPTVGHEIWLAKVERWVNPGDVQTSLAVNCFALSRPWQDLPDPDSPSVITASVEPFLNSLKDFTREQLMAAIRYAICGSEQSVGEHSAYKAKDESDYNEDLGECVAVGVLNQGRAALFGISEADMRSMTVRQLSDTIRDAYALHGITLDGETSRLEAGFWATADEIEKRLSNG